MARRFLHSTDFTKRISLPRPHNTSPRKVVEIHAEALTKIISKDPKKDFKFEEIEEAITDKWG